MGLKTAEEVVRKTANEVIPVDFIFTRALASTEEVTSISVQPTVAPTTSPALVAAAGVISADGKQVQTSLSAGLAGTKYTVSIRVVTDGGKTLDAVGTCVVLA